MLWIFIDTYCIIKAALVDHHDKYLIFLYFKQILYSFISKDLLLVTARFSYEKKRNRIAEKRGHQTR